MDTVLVHLLESVGRPIALALVHSLWQGVIVAALVAAALLLLRRRSATLRYAVACIGMLAILTATVGTAVWFARHPEPPQDQRLIWRPATAAAAGGDPSAVGPTGEMVEAVPLGTSSGTEAFVVEEEPVSQPAASGLPILDMELAGPWIFFAWVAGATLLAIVHLIGWRRASAFARLGTSAIPTVWRNRLDRLSDLLGVARSVHALTSTRVSVPTVVGWLRPIVLIPASSFTDLTASDLEMILIHELAHVRRHDILVNYLQATAETLLFYHPAVWWISHRIRIEREHCCDDAAVRATGDGVAYARALSEVERMRGRTPVHAMAADGGAFRSRIRRLVGAEPSAASPRRAGFAGVLVVTMVVGLAIPSLTAAPVGTASAQVPAPVSAEWKNIEGEWQATGFGGSIKLHFERRGWGEFSLTFDDEFGEAGDGVYHLEREAGTFILEGGRFPRGWRKAVFRPDPEYAAEMQGLGYDIEDEEDLLELAIHDVTLDFARGIAAAGYDISRTRLIEFHIHDVTPEYVRAMADAGYDQLTPGKIVEFRIHDIEPDYVKRMAAVGYDELTPSRIVEFKIHDIEPEYVERMAAIGYEDLTPDRIVEFSIHGIDPEYVEKMAAIRYEGLTPSRIVEFSIHGITPEYVGKMAASGFEELTPSRIVEFSIHGITPEFVRGLAEVGYGDMSPSRIVEFRIHDVTPEFIRDLADHGITDVSAAKLIEYRISGIPWEAIKKDSSSM